jgi:hypothetical protein
MTAPRRAFLAMGATARSTVAGSALASPEAFATSSALTTRSNDSRPALAERGRTPSPPTNPSPTGSPVARATRAMAAARSAAYAYFAPGEPSPRYAMEAVASTQSHTARSVSVSNSRTMSLSCRRSARRSMKRRSSPGTYARWPPNSTPAPLRTLR